MVEGIDPLHMRLAQLMGDDPLLAQAPVAPPSVGVPAAPEGVKFTGSPFEDVLSRAIDALEGVSKSEARANQLIDRYVRGEADLQDVMLETSKMSIMVQLAVTTVNLAVTTFKEITQMQI